MKRFLSFLALAALLFSCEELKPDGPDPTPTPPAPTTISVSSVSLSPSSLTLTEGDKETLSATVLPDNATDKTIEWSTSDATIVSVDENGKITAVKAGTATITVKTKDGGKTATCKITVVPSSISGEHEGTGQEIWE